MLTSSVLVLNQSFLPVHITQLKHAFCLLFRNVAKAVDEEYQLFDFASWSDLAAVVGHETIGLVDRKIRVPRVILLTAYNRMPSRDIRFSRINILIRDNYTCQYCHKQFSKSSLNLDHVIPRSKGGLSTWENVVASCLRCNCRKGGQTPREAGMRLMKPPKKPSHYPFSTLLTRRAFHDSWKPFLNVVDFSYWNTELEP